MSDTSQRHVRRIVVAGIGLMLFAIAFIMAIVSSSSLNVSVTPTPDATPPVTPFAPHKLLTITLTPPPALSDLATQYPGISNVLLDPELNSTYKSFFIAYQQGGLDAAIDLARQRGILTAQNEIRATLILDAPYSDELVKQLEATGVVVESAYKTQIDVAVPVAVIQRAIDAGQPEVVFKSLTELQHVIRIKLPDQLKPDVDHSLAPTTGQGVRVIGADAWQRAGLTGAGVRVGILDCGFKGYKALLGTELPASVDARSFVRGLSDTNESDEEHGTAVAEIVHEVAPDAELFLADYGCRGGPPEGKAVDWLLAQGVRIISNSTGNPAAPMDGSGWSVELAQSATDQGVLWINSAGNEAERHYRGSFTDADGNRYHEFASDQETLGFQSDKPEIEITLRWDDWLKNDQDFDLLLLDAAGNTLAASRDQQSGMPGDRPVEEIAYRSLTPGAEYRVAIYAARADRTVTFDLYFDGEVVIERPTADHSLISPADARAVIAVGAASWDTDRITDYSSRGPTADDRIKPDLAAPTGVDNATYHHFGGTSASAPHVAGAAALVLSAFPSFDRQQLSDYLINNALDLGSPGVDDAYGAGRLQLPLPLAAPAIATATPTSVKVLTLTSTTAPTLIPTTSATVTPTFTPSPTPALTPTLTVTPVPPSSGPASSTEIPVALIGVGGGFLLLLTIVVVVLRARRRRPPATGLPQSPAPQMPPPAPPASQLPQGPAPRVPTAPAPGAQPKLMSSAAVCPHCGRAVRAGAKFCAACGKAITPPVPIAPSQPQMQYCKNCHQPLRPGAKFCAKCGMRQ